MGMGEPLANLDNLLEALAIACSPDGLGLSARHVTISTVGLPGKIRRFADLGKAYHLAVSLHAPNDKLRNRIVPTNETVGLSSILGSGGLLLPEKTAGRQVTYEYVLLGGINDSRQHAAELSRLLRGRRGAPEPDPVQRRGGGLPVPSAEQRSPWPTSWPRAAPRAGQSDQG